MNIAITLLHKLSLCVPKLYISHRYLKNRQRTDTYNDNKEKILTICLPSMHMVF